MKSKKIFVYLIVSFLCFLLSGYSFLGLVMISWLSATPNYPPERAAYNMKFYIPMFLISILSAIVFLGLTVVNAKRKHQ